MGSFRMRRSFKVAPGLRLNVSKSGLSTSTKLGPVTVNSRGRATVRVAKGVSYSASTRGGRSSGARSTTPTRVSAKSGGVTFVLWLLTGLVGGHRYYLGRTGTAFLQTITLGGVGVWWLLDLLLLPGLVRDRNRLAGVVAALLLAIASVAPATAQNAPPRGIPNDAELATVRSVVDGDTIRVTLADGTKGTVRLIGIDTPETKAPGEPVGCFGPEASARMEQLLPAGREIWLESDETNRDRYDRLLRYVWVEKSDGGRYLANEVMVRDGYALAIRYSPDTARAERLEAAQGRAVAAGRGLWGACPEFVVSLTPVPTAAPIPTDVPVVVEQPVEVPPIDTAPIGIASGCDPSYPELCLASFPDLDCADVGARRFTVYPPDPHGFDGDFDGIGCES